MNIKQKEANNMQIEIEVTGDVEIECPHCKKMIKAVDVTVNGTVEIEPPDRY